MPQTTKGSRHGIIRPRKGVQTFPATVHFSAMTELVVSQRELKTARNRDFSGMAFDAYMTTTGPPELKAP